MQSPTPAGSRRAYWACQLGGWYGTALFQIAVVFSFVSTTPSPDADAETRALFAMFQAALGETFAWFVAHLLLLHTGGLVLAHGLHGFIKRRRWAERGFAGKSWRVLLAGLLLSAPLGLTQQFTAAGVLHQGLDVGIPWLTQLQRAIQWAPYFWCWMVVYFVLLSQRRLRFAELHRSELTRALQQAELRALKAQLNPHFLFNSLNSVRALIADQPARAQDAVTQLARTLRYTLASGKDELVTLAQEMEIVDDYLALEALRLGGRLRVERAIAADALAARVPVMLVQTLVENAIKHGIAELPEGGTLRLAARRQDGHLALDVENPRPPMPRPTAHAGVGLRNAAERLLLLFGGAARLDLDLSRADRAVARLRLPA